MITYIRHIALFIIVLSISAISSHGIQSNDREFITGVYSKLLKCTESVSKYLWPAEVIISTDTIIDAGTTVFYNPDLDKFGFRIEITTGLMKKIISNDDNIMAFILGHELAHIIMNHFEPANKKQPELITKILRVSDEFDADLQGMRLAIDAGFSYNTIIKYLRKMADNVSAPASFHYLSREHPSWSDRLERLDQDQSQLWKSMSAFRNGVELLSLDQYQPSIYCFNYVLDQFPGCGEAHVNLGYAKLMEYIEAMDYEDFNIIGIGNFVTGGFYRTPSSIKASIRGIDTDLWWDAVGEFQNALRINKDLVLANANLGLAYLISPNPRRLLGRAEKFLSEAITLAENDSTIDDAAKASIYLNAGLSYMISSKSEDSINSAIDKARDYVRRFAEFNTRNDYNLIIDIDNSLKFNKAFMLSKSTNKVDLEKSRKLFEEYLSTSPLGNVWWKIAQRNYQQLSERLKIPQNKSLELINERNTRLKPVLGIKSSKGSYLMITERKDKFLSNLKDSQVEETTVLPGKNLKRVKIKDLGIELLTSEYIFAIFLNSKISPPIALMNARNGVMNANLRVGMSIRELEDAVGTLDNKEKVNLITSKDNYRYYPDVGLAVKINFPLKIVEELVLVQLPEE